MMMLQERPLKLTVVLNTVEGRLVLKSLHF